MNPCIAVHEKENIKAHILWIFCEYSQNAFLGNNQTRNSSDALPGMNGWIYSDMTMYSTRQCTSKFRVPVDFHVDIYESHSSYAEWKKPDERDCIEVLCAGPYSWDSRECRLACDKPFCSDLERRVLSTHETWWIQKPSGDGDLCTFMVVIVSWAQKCQTL